MKQVKEENDNQSASLLTSKWLHVQTIITHNALISADTIDGNSTSWCIKFQRTLTFSWSQNQMSVSRSHCLRSNSNGTHRFRIAILFRKIIERRTKKAELINTWVQDEPSSCTQVFISVVSSYSWRCCGGLQRLDQTGSYFIVRVFSHILHRPFSFSCCYSNR